jgi:ParB/RepB/Spo0J family partition protein
MAKPKLLLLDPAEIELSDNIRGEISEDDARRMAQDLLEAGCQLQPVGVRRVPGGGWRLVYGHRRVAGLLWLQRNAALPEDSPLRQASAIEVPSREEELIIQIRENSARRNLKPVEEAELIRDLLADGRTVEQVARIFGRSAGWVTQRHTLLSLPPEVLQAVGSRISPYDGYHLARMNPREREARVRELIGEKPDSGVRAVRRKRPSSRDVSRLLSRLRKSCPEAGALLDNLILYLEGQRDGAEAERRIREVLQRQ